MIPFTVQNIPWYVGIVVSTAGMWSLVAYFERRESRRKSSFVRSKLMAERCLLCGSPLSAWDGQLVSVDIDFDPGAYCARLGVDCSACHSKNEFYFFDKDDEDGDCSLIPKRIFDETYGA